MASIPLSPLGRPAQYLDHYDGSLLFPIARALKRAEIGVGDSPLFFGADVWTAFELSWLNRRGKPQVALAHITVPAESTHIVESKSFDDVIFQALRSPNSKLSTLWRFYPVTDRDNNI